MWENVAEDGAVEAGNTRGSGDESLEIRRQDNNFVDRVIVVVRKLVECEKGSDNDLRVSIRIGVRGALDEVLELSGVGFNDRIESSYNSKKKKIVGTSRQQRDKKNEPKNVPSTEVPSSTARST